MGHLEQMRHKLARLRELDAVAEMDRRWDDYGDEYDYEMLMLRDGVELQGHYPGGLAELYRETDRPVFGEVRFRPEDRFKQAPAVDAEGNRIDDRDRTQIAALGEDAVLLDEESGRVMIYWYSYFKYGWDTGVVLECASIPEFVDTVCLGARFADIKGPREKQKTPWWEAHPWYCYLQEIGMALERRGEAYAGPTRIRASLGREQHHPLPAAAMADRIPGPRCVLPRYRLHTDRSIRRLHLLSGGKIRTVRHHQP